jgi:hypothetical protein
MRPAIPAGALGIILLSITSGYQKRIKARIERVSRVDRVKAGLKGLSQLLSRRLHSPSSPAR